MDKEAALLQLKDRVRHLGLKLTKQREAICDVFFSQSSHRGAEEILRDVRVRDPRVSLATVYRFLKLLTDAGLAESHNFQDGQSRFEPRFEDSEHHDHIICTKCGRIVEFVNAAVEQLQIKIAASHGFVITDHKMELYGLCAQCQ